MHSRKGSYMNDRPSLTKRETRIIWAITLTLGILLTGLTVMANVTSEVLAVAAWMDANSVEAAALLQAEFPAAYYALKARAIPKPTTEQQKAILESTKTELVLKGIAEDDSVVADIDKRIGTLQLEIDAAAEPIGEMAEGGGK